jgi:hypothetical protein
LSLLQERSFSDPDKLADDCKLAGLKDLAGCAVILKNCPFKLQEVDDLLIEGMDMRFALESVVNVDDELPFGVALPVGSSLDLLINPKVPSGLALIETLFRSLIRHQPRGQGGLVKDFEGNVAARAKRDVEAEVEVVEANPGGGGDSPVAGRSRLQKRKAGDPAKPTLVVVIGALFDCMAAELSRVWTTEVHANGAEFVLPAPLLTALLEEHCCLAAISDLLITLQLPEVASTAWGYALPG